MKIIHTILSLLLLKNIVSLVKLAPYIIVTKLVSLSKVKKNVI